MGWGGAREAMGASWFMAPTDDSGRVNTASLTQLLIQMKQANCQRLILEDDGAGGTSFTTQETDWLPTVPSIGVLWEF